MTVIDNGKGFDLEIVKNKKTTLGLQNMIERAALINFTLEINSTIDAGTIIKLTENIN
jgi:signal transduction histidine kinase